MRSSVVFFVLFSIILSVTYAAPILDIPVVERTIDRDLTIAAPSPVLDQDRIVRSDVIADKTVVDGNFAILEPITQTDVLKRSEILKDDRFVEKSSIVTPTTTDVVEPTLVRDNFFVEKSGVVEPIIVREPLYVEKDLTKEPIFVEKKKIITPVTTGVTTTSIVKDNLFVERSGIVRPVVTKEPIFVEGSDVAQPLITKEPVFVEKRDIVTPVTTGVSTSTILKDNFFVEPIIAKEPVFVEKRDVVTPIVVEPVVEKSVVDTPIRTTIPNRFITLGGVQPTVDAGTKVVFKRPVFVERIGSTVGTNIFSGSRIVRRVP